MDSKPLRIAQVVGNMASGGVEAVVMNYYRNIDRSKVQFDFIVYDTSTHVPQEEIEELGGRVFFIPNYKNLCAHQKALLKLFKENKYDIVHSHLNTLSVFSLKMAKKAGVKVRIAHSHSTSNKKEWKRNIIKNILRPFSKKYATHYFACSELAGRWLFGDKTFERGEVTVINNAIDLERFKFNENTRKELREELGLEKNFVVGHIGRFMAQKNHTFLIDIFNEVQKRRPEARLLLLGNGPLYDEILKKVEDLGLTEKVIFEGVHKHPERYYQAMDCFVLPSLYEGLPVVGIEAQANGLKCYLSSEMTKETKILDTTQFLSLSEGDKAWAEKISADLEAEVADGSPSNTCSDRLQGYIELTDSKYNIVTEAQKLNEMYEKMQNGGGYRLLIFTVLSEEQAYALGKKEKIVLGHVGRFMPQKNQTFLLDVFNEVQKTRTEARLLLLGDGPMYDEIQAKAEKLGLKDKVIFAGVQPNPERYYQAMDCFVLPSLYEGLGMVCIEAQVSGLPCFVSTEVPREVRVGTVDFISLKNSAREWAKEINDKLIQSEASIMGEREERQKAYRRFSGSLYDINFEAQKLLGYYEEMLNRD